MARQTTDAMDAALAAPRACITGFLEVNLPGAVNVRLFFGSGKITWDGKDFLGRDPTFGVLESLDPPEDGFGEEAPGMGFAILPADDAAAASLAAPEMQGSRTRFWLVALDDDGVPVADPLELFDGQLDQPVITLDAGARSLEYECVSDMEKLFENEEGRRLSDASHKEIWPDEQGLVGMTGLVKRRIWGPGEQLTGSGVVYGGGGGGSGGGGRSAMSLMDSL